MSLLLWLVAAALPLAAQPKLLVNAKPDTRSAAAGLEQTFRSLVTAQPQPAWIAYSVPSTRAGLGCDYVRDAGASPALSTWSRRITPSSSSAWIVEPWSAYARCRRIARLTPAACRCIGWPI